MESKPPLSGHFHQSTKRRRLFPQDETQWPEEWKTILYKGYPRLAQKNLPPHSRTADLFEVLRKRRSKRVFSGKPLSGEEISALLFGCGIQKERAPARTYPSAGGRYPLEAYLAIFVGSAEYPPGLYHYNLKDHSLECLFEKEFTGREKGELFTYPWAVNATAALFLTGVFSRNQSKYGERGYRQILLEAGHVGQNLYLIAEAHGLSCCALTGTHDEKIEQLLDVDGVTESLVYAFLFG